MEEGGLGVRPSTRIFRAGLAGIFLAGVLASCGGAGTGEGSAAAKAPAAQSAAPVQAVTAKALILQVDTVRGPNGLTDDEKTYLSCVQQNRFPQGSQLVWRARVVDPISAKGLDDKAVKSFVLTLPDGTTSNLKYGGHGGPNKTDDFFWTTSFQIPPTYPTGSFSYKLTATSAEGLVGTFDQFKIATAMTQIVPVGKR